MKAKICGITRLEDALLAIEYGTWAIGFNFYEKSARYISPEKASLIIQNLPKKCIKIGIFIDKSQDYILKMMVFLGLDYAQIYACDLTKIQPHGKFILSLNVNAESELPALSTLSEYYAVLLDAPFSPSTRLLGGTGRLANWDLAKKLATQCKLILAGGLTAENIRQAIEAVKPFAVDVASGVESFPGKKNAYLLKQFILGANHEPS